MRALSLRLAAVVGAAFIGSAFAQQFVYPAKGRSPDQQKKDEAACHSWAVEQSKFDPSKPPRGQSRKQNAATAQQGQQQASQQQQAGQQAYQKARSACLEGKGYTIKGPAGRSHVY